MRALYVCLLILALGFGGGCGDGDDQVLDDTTSTDNQYTGSMTPAQATFELHAETEGRPAAVVLLGSNVVVDQAAGTVAVDVVMVNHSDDVLYPPAVVWLQDLRPDSVVVVNADLQATLPPGGAAFGFDYSASFGDDAVLAPDETSSVKTWVFSVPGLVSFTFGARVVFSPQPGQAAMSGICFRDENRDGTLDPTERRLEGGRVVARGPEGRELVAQADSVGRWTVPVDVAGLWSVRYTPPVIDGGTWVFTTPNPLSVVMVPGPDGLPVNFDRADFGAVTIPFGAPCPQVAVTDSLPPNLPDEPWQLLNGGVDGDFLRLQVGFSGCEPNHPFAVFMRDGFMESNPVQARLELRHLLAEDCDAAWTQGLCFDLAPIRRAYIAAYGQPGVVLLHLSDPQGHQQTFRFGP